MKTRLQYHLFTLLLSTFFSTASLAAYTCASIFSSTLQLPSLHQIQELYQKTGSEIVTHQMTYHDHLTNFQLMLLTKTDDLTLIDYYHQPQFIEKTNKRLKLLFSRPLNLSKNAQLLKKLKKAQELKTHTDHWIKNFELARANKPGPFTLDQFRNFEFARAPRIDQGNITSYKDITNWQNAVQHVYSLARYKAPLSREGLLEVIARLHGTETIQPWPGEHIINGLSINLMKQSDLQGFDMTDPTNVFPAGTSKKQLMDDFLNWLHESEGSVHPILLSAQARQRIVSIHPLPDGNGRLARIIGDYVLMKAGYPPATIGKSKAGRNRSVALFPLKDWKEQITPEETLQITLDGVLESYQRILDANI